MWIHLKKRPVAGCYEAFGYGKCWGTLDQLTNKSSFKKTPLFMELVTYNLI
jgi:hypothetical protein